MEVTRATHQLLTLPATNRSAFFILAPEEALLLALNDHLVFAERALFKALEASGFNVLPLLDAFVQSEEPGSQETLELGLRERQFAAGLVYAEDVRVMSA
jgi:hypothetical protein